MAARGTARTGSGAEPGNPPPAGAPGRSVQRLLRPAADRQTGRPVVMSSTAVDPSRWDGISTVPC
ncbi:hypothetical protein FB570_101707 [Streptomyces sp. T12]|nr:hypothetical protein FB570_101707 [Streptomyces sp. T12]